MQAFVFGLATPLLPLFLRKLYKKEETLSARELFFRYVVYTFLMTVFTAFVMVFLCDEGTSFLGKVDASPGFALKYLLIQLFGAAALAGLEWAYETRRLAVTVDRESFEKNVLFRICRKVLSLGIYLLAALTAVLNATLLFDNVLWGDEAYSANLMRNNLKDMMQIITLEEPHPPLYYLWLKMWVELLGKNGAVYHAASFFLFLIGAVLAVTLLRKRYGKIPASFFLVVTGMSAMGLTYNVEIRMYAMACLGVTFCYYCAGRVLKQNRFLSWAGMVFWALVAAYSHYFALLAAVVTMTAACLFAVWRFGKKTWISTAAAAAAFLAGYAPWLQFMCRAVNRVRGNWWLEESSPLSTVAPMIFGGNNMMKLLLPLVLLMLVCFLLADSAVFEGKRENGKFLLKIRSPRASVWPAETCILLTGFLTVFLTVAVGYLAAFVYRPILAPRYVYPLMGVVAVMLVVGGSHFLDLLGEKQKAWNKNWITAAGKGVLLLLLAALFVTGYQDYRSVSAEMKLQSARTQDTLASIGEPVENMVLVNNGVKHIGWTVLNYYYPEAEIINNQYVNVSADDFWYFTPEPLTKKEISQQIQNGYAYGDYGEHQIATYTFTLYHFFKMQ